MKKMTILAFILAAFTIGCGEDNGILPTIGQPKPTHTLQEVFDDMRRGIEYTDQTITIEATVVTVDRKTANEDIFTLDTSKLEFKENTRTGFSVIAKRGKYKTGETYTFTVFIQSAVCEYTGVRYWCDVISKIVSE